MKNLGSKTYMCLLVTWSITLFSLNYCVIHNSCQDCAPSRLKCAFNCPLMDGWRDGFTGLQSEDWMTVCDSVSSRCNGCVEVRNSKRFLLDHFLNAKWQKSLKRTRQVYVYVNTYWRLFMLQFIICFQDCANMTGAGTTKVANITLLFTVIAVSLMF